MDTPSSKLAEVIIEKLVSEKLLNSEQQKRLFPKLVEGKMKSEDWRLAVETANRQEPEK